MALKVRMLSHHILDTPSLSSDSHQDRSSVSPGLEDEWVLVMSNTWLSQGLDTRAWGLSITWYYSPDDVVVLPHLVVSSWTRSHDDSWRRPGHNKQRSGLHSSLYTGQVLWILHIQVSSSSIRCRYLLTPDVSFQESQWTDMRFWVDQEDVERDDHLVPRPGA